MSCDQNEALQSYITTLNDAIESMEQPCGESAALTSSAPFREDRLPSTVWGVYVAQGRPLQWDTIPEKEKKIPRTTSDPRLMRECEWDTEFSEPTQCVRRRAQKFRLRRRRWGESTLVVLSSAVVCLRTA